MNRVFDRRTLAYALLSLFALSAAVGAAATCGPYNGPDCEHPDFNHHDQNGDFDPCHCDDDAGSVGYRGPLACNWYDAGTPPDAASDGPIEGGPILTDADCAGQCWPDPPAGWTLPLLLTIGFPGITLSCPAAAPSVAYQGLGDLQAPSPECGACSCDTPSGHCSLPSTITANNGTCIDQGPITISSNPPSKWNGACTNQGAIPAGALCNGSLCVRSVMIGPLDLSEAGCTPHAPAPPTIPPVTWTSAALACTGTSGSCSRPGEICGPPAAPGFSICVFQTGDVACPSFGPYVERHLFAQGVSDTRGCSPCACGPPLGSTCGASVSIYPDDMCASDAVSVMLDTTGPRCVDVAAGTALGSKAATPAYVPGNCQASGGQMTGSVEMLSPATFCCLPES